MKNGEVPMTDIPDPRLVLIKKNLSKVKNIYAVSSGKGGVGKSVIATTASLLLAKKGHNVGLLDLDFYGPSCLKILGEEIEFPKEERGLIPPTTHGVKVMSIEYFTKDNPLPLRGDEISNAITEVLAITIWGELDHLIIDLPPGMGDELLDIIKMIKGAKHIVVTTPSILSLTVAEKLIKMLKKTKEETFGVILNMVREEKEVDLEAPILGRINYDKKLDSALGNVERILSTNFAKELGEIIEKHFT